MYVAAPMLALLLCNIGALAADPRAELAAAYNEAPQAADHLVMLDLGGATPDQVAELRASVRGIAETLPVGDRLAVYAFSEQVSRALPRTMVDDAARDGLVAMIDTMPLPVGARSDLGAALSEARDALHEPGHLDAAMVVVFSDFCHDPPDTSRFTFPGTTGCRQVRGLSELTDGFKALSSEQLIQPVAVTVGKVDSAGRSAFFQALGKGDTLAFSGGDPLAQRYAEGMPWRKLKGLVRRELTGYALSAEVVPSEGDHVRVRVKSGLQRLGMELNSVSFSDPALVPASTKLSLTPEGEIELVVQDAEAPLSLIPASRTVVIEGNLRANATLEPRTGLSVLGFSPGRGQIRIPLHVEWTQRYGPPGWLLAVIALVALGVLGAVVRRSHPN